MTIGHEPVLDRLNLVDNQDLYHLFVEHGTPLPDGSAVSITITDREHDYVYGAWPTTKTAEGWVLNVVAADLAEIPHGARFRVYALYPDGARYCWIAGPVNRSRR